MRDFQQGAADSPEFTHHGARDVNAAGGEILAEGGHIEVTAEFGLPDAGLLERVGIDRFVGTAVYRSIRLQVTVQVDAPDPWVPVATAPAMLMCGSDARFVRARECSCSAEASVPYFIPALTVTVAPSTATSSGSPLISTRSPEVSAMSLKQCLLPRAFTRSAPATIS